MSFNIIVLKVRKESSELALGLEGQRMNFFLIWRKESWFKSKERDYRNVV